MRRFAFALVISLVLALAGCGLKQSVDSSDAAVSANAVYFSNISTSDCFLCGDGIDHLASAYWGQNNIALISLNTFEIKPIEINRYDKMDGRLLEEYAGTVSFGGGGSINGGFSASLSQDYDRGYADGSVDFCNDEVLNISKMADYLCEDCLNKILPWQVDRCFGVGAINLATKEVRIFEESTGGFSLGDFYIDCNLQGQDDDGRRMNILIFYCPVRYKEGTGTDN